MKTGERLLLLAFVLLLGTAHAIILSYRVPNDSTPSSDAERYEPLHAGFYWTMYIPDPGLAKEEAYVDLRELWTSLREYRWTGDDYVKTAKKGPDPIGEDSRKLPPSSTEARIQNPDVP